MIGIEKNGRGIRLGYDLRISRSTEPKHALEA
jgi:hypothetical protein